MGDALVMHSVPTALWRQAAAVSHSAATLTRICAFSDQPKLLQAGHMYDAVLSHHLNGLPGLILSNTVN